MSSGETITFTVTGGIGNLYFAEDGSFILGGKNYTNFDGRVVSTNLIDSYVTKIRVS